MPLTFAIWLSVARAVHTRSMFDWIDTADDLLT